MITYIDMEISHLARSNSLGLQMDGETWSCLFWLWGGERGTSWYGV